MATDASSGSFDLPFVATLLRTALRTTDFYFLGNPKNLRQAAKVKGEADHAPSPPQQAQNDLAGNRLFVAVWSEAGKNK